MPKFLDQVFAKTSPKRSFSMIENESFGLNFAKTGSINSGTGDMEAYIWAVDARQGAIGARLGTRRLTLMQLSPTLQS